MELFVLVVGFVLVVAAPLLIVTVGAPPGEHVDRSIVGPRIERAQRSLVLYTNTAGGYGFRYPSSWDLTEVGTSARLESPGGDTVVSFGLGDSGDLEASSARLLESMPGSGSSQGSIGRKRARIAGSPSLLASGAARDEAGRPVRFLAIAIRGGIRNYAISIIVPRGSDPGRVLPRVERIVSSFVILGGRDVDLA